MKTFLTAFLLVLGLSLSANAATRAEVITHLSHHVIMATYVDFAQNSISLKNAIATLTQSPTQKNLEAAQEAWRKARGSYEVSEGFLFGPMDALGIDPMIDTWPLALTDLKKILNSSYILDLDFVRTLGSEVQGFHAIEFLLFGEGVVSNTKDVRTFTARDFQYLAAASYLLAEQTERLLSAWNSHLDPEDDSTPAYLDVFSKPGQDNPYYSTEEAVVQELANGIVGIINEASTAKLPDATGNDIEDANARLEESPFSWNSINDYTSNIDSVINIYTGLYNGNLGPGIKDLVANTDPALAQEIEAEMLNARALIIAVRGPNNMSFGQAIKDRQGRLRIFAAIHALRALQKNLETKVLPLL